MIERYLSLVKFSHTIFALPFAVTGFVMGISQPGAVMSWTVFFLVLLCMVTARNAAMAFNRYSDRTWDALNPRTAIREIPAGTVSSGAALVFVLINATIFICASWLINPLCGWLSPIALLVILGYSYTKRFTALCHLILGLGLALAPVGAYIAVTGVFAWPPVLLGCIVLFWVSGFDIIYALQDESFDKEVKLHSIPAAIGKRKALMVSNILHIICALLIAVFMSSIYTTYEAVGYLSFTGAALFVCFLIYQHTLVKPDDLSRVNLAFATTNGMASVVFGACVIVDFLLA